MFCGVSCKQVYSPPAIKNNPHLLVVDGIVKNGNDSTVIILSRTRSVADTVPSEFETNARVSIVSANSLEYPLFSEGNGRYIINPLQLDTTQEYQLKIITAEGNEFRSELSHVYGAPPIDSLYFTQDDAGVHIYLDSHDPTNSTRYYRWEYIQTWQYNSDFISILEYIDSNNIVQRTPDNQIYTCWQSQASTSIEVAKTTQLSSDIISKYEMTVVPKGSIQISFLYSDLVYQYAISADAYNFWQNLKKNTEQLGSLFDLQPFTELGNITCVNNPDVKCIGYISFTTPKEKRIFISKNQVISWNYTPYYAADSCKLASVPPDNLPSFFQPDGGPYFNSLVGMAVSNYLVSTKHCVDCRANGGTTTKPPYWP
jgi:hypothetical protein